MFTTRRRGWLAAAMALSVTGSLALAQDAGQTARKARQGAPAGAKTEQGEGKGAKGAGQRGAPGGGLMQRLTSELGLTEEQQTQIKALVQQHFEEARQQAEQSEKGQQIKAIREEMRKAREAGDQAKLEELRKQLRELAGDDQANRREQVQQNLEALRAKITPLLTPEQQKKFAEMKFDRGAGGAGAVGGNIDPRRLRGVLQNLDLTKEQKQAAEEIFAKAKEEMQSIPQDDRAARMQVGQRVMSEIRNLLTDEQKTKLEEQLSKARTRGDGEGAGQGKGRGRGRGHGDGKGAGEGGSEGEGAK